MPSPRSVGISETRLISPSRLREGAGVRADGCQTPRCRSRADHPRPMPSCPAQ